MLQAKSFLFFSVTLRADATIFLKRKEIREIPWCQNDQTFKGISDFENKWIPGNISAPKEAIDLAKAVCFFTALADHCTLHDSHVQGQLCGPDDRI